MDGKWKNHQNTLEGEFWNSLTLSVIQANYFACIPVKPPFSDSKGYINMI